METAPRHWVVTSSLDHSITSSLGGAMEAYSLYRHMRLGIVHFKAFPEVEFGGSGSMVETLRKIAEDDFFTAVEIGPSRDVRVRHQVRQLLEVSHLTVCYATQPTVLGGKLNP